MLKPSPMSWAEESWMHLMVLITGSADSLCPAFQAQCWVLCQLHWLPHPPSSHWVSVPFPPLAAFPFSLHFMLLLTTLHFPPFHDPELLPLKILFLHLPLPMMEQIQNKHNGLREQHCNGMKHQTYSRIRCFCKGERTLPSFVFHRMRNNDQDLKMVFTHCQF